MNLFILSLIAGLLYTNSQANDISLQDFSEAYSLKLQDNSAIHAVDLPLEIYEKLVQEDLGDICVFNGKGNPVPYFIRTVDQKERVRKRRDLLPFFPLSLPGNQHNQHDSSSEDLSIRVSRNSSGTIVNVAPLSGDHLSSGIINSYLIDLSNTAKHISELEFFWQQNSNPTLLNLTIEQSNDLVTWSPAVAKASLANIRYLGNRVVKRNITLGVDTKKYLKVTWAPLQQNFKVTEVFGYFSKSPSSSDFYWTEATAFRQVTEKKEIFAEFKLDKKIETELVQVVFPEKPSLKKLRILSKKNEDKNWVRRCDALFYDFRVEGTGLRNDPCVFSATKDNEWRVSQNVDFSNGNGAFDKLKMRFGWRRHELLFVSQGDPPFLLAYGNGKFVGKNQAVQNDTILRVLRDSPMKQVIQRAEVIGKVVIGGEKALELPAAPLPWKKWVLWLVLVAGVACLAYMVRNLMSEIKEQKRG